MQRLVSFTALVILASALVAHAQETPKAEVFGGYSYLRANQVSAAGCCFNMNGGIGSVAIHSNSWLSWVGEVGGYKNGNVHSTSTDLTLVSYLFGPRLSYSKTRIMPFAQALVGGAHAGGSLYTTAGLSSSNGFAVSTGGGLDIKVSRLLALRLIQADYLFTKLQNGTNDRENNLRLSAGIVLRFGGK